MTLNTYQELQRLRKAVPTLYKASTYSQHQQTIYNLEGRWVT